MKAPRNTKHMSKIPPIMRAVNDLKRKSSNTGSIAKITAGIIIANSRK